ncbi:MAG: Stk1 family PASTA domain-containing Ser/Thr kinase [Clostridia bacterium]|nr:Stk1 family PASTA domain-containing Ser/Thr kinase [Clostridia bacterium]
MDKYVGKRLDGRYEIKEIIGVGGMAHVYKAYDNIDNRIVAVKILKEEYLQNEEFTRRFKNESKAIAILSHPNIVKVYDVSFGDRMQYIVMEYIDGITLKEYIEGQAEFKWKEAVHFTVQILRALQHAHDKGIVHRDIKPQNIMLLPDGTIKVADFGIARFSRQDIRTTRSSDKAIGSVHYISPEQARGEITDEKADIYSVGVMLYEMLTGKLPFEADSAVSVAIMQMQSEAQPPRQINAAIPEGLEDITIKAMQKDTSKRYQSAAEMLYDIDEFKKNPSIHFEYKYFVDDSPTRYMDTISKVRGTEPVKPTGRVKAEEVDEEVEEKKGFPIIPVLCAVIGAFVLIAAIFVFVVMGDKFFNNNSEQVEVPSFVGMTLDQISSNPDYMQWFTFETANEQYSNEAAGTVIDQSLEAGIMVKKGVKSIKLTVSKGPNLVQIPNVVGQHRDAAQAALENAGFVVKYTLDVSDEVAVDFVISLSPAEYPDKMQYGSDITMVVSSGETPAEPVAMPDVTNVPKDQAIALLETAGFTVTETDITYVDDSSVPANTVIWQSVAADTPTVPGTVIKLRVSTGYTQAKVQIQLPTQMGTPIDMQVYVNGELRNTFTGLLPNEVKVKDVTVSERMETYTVTVRIADNGKGNYVSYAKYSVNGKTGTVSITEEPNLNALTPATTTTPAAAE